MEEDIDVREVTIELCYYICIQMSKVDGGIEFEELEEARELELQSFRTQPR